MYSGDFEREDEKEIASVWHLTSSPIDASEDFDGRCAS